MFPILCMLPDQEGIQDASELRVQISSEDFVLQVRFIVLALQKSASGIGFSECKCRVIVWFRLFARGKRDMRPVCV